MTAAASADDDRGAPAPGPPLAGLRVLDLSRLVAGNQLTMLLADFGADVVKVERPGAGDPLRSWLTGGLDLDWKVYARNKRSLVLDLKEPADREVLLGLAESADVLVESFRPGNLERLGLGPDVLWGRNRRLVIARVSGWGQTGSYAEKPAFGTLVEAMSGFAEANGFPDREPVLPPTAQADMIAGTYGAFGVLLALRHAESAGIGQVVDVSLFESLFSTLGPTAAMFTLCGELLGRHGNRSQTTAPRNIYRTHDGGWLALSASAQSMAERLFGAIHRAELAEDERFRDNDARVRNVDELDRILGDHFAARDLADAVREMEGAGVTAGPVANVSSLLGSEFFRTRDVVVEVRDESGRAVPMHNVVPRLSRTPGSVRTAGPPLGHHAEQPWATAAPRAITGGRRMDERVREDRRADAIAPPYWRSMLSVPASSQRFLERAHTRGADAILLDLEDGVAPSEKDHARRELGRAIESVSRGPADILVRINEPWELARRDVDAAVHPDVAAIELPKVSSAEQVRRLSELVERRSERRGLQCPPALVLTIEGPIAADVLDDACAASPLTLAVELGAEDFSQVLCVEPDSENPPVGACRRRARRQAIRPAAPRPRREPRQLSGPGPLPRPLQALPTLRVHRWQRHTPGADSHPQQRVRSVTARARGGTAGPRRLRTCRLGGPGSRGVEGVDDRRARGSESSCCR